MIRRLVFPLIALFWVAMNALLWRAEWGGRTEPGSPVPFELVWKKILTTPDGSTLAVLSRGKNVGYCRWAPNVGQALAESRLVPEEDEPDGQVRRLAGYTIDAEGNFSWNSTTNRVRFSLHLALSANQTCQELALRIASRAGRWQVRSDAGTETLSIEHEEASRQWSYSLTWADLRNPEALLRSFGLDPPPGWLGTSATDWSSKAISLGLRWEARTDWLQTGHARVRVYRLQARLLDRYQATVFVSRVGEILRVELPNDLVLVNDALYSL